MDQSHFLSQEAYELARKFYASTKNMRRDYPNLTFSLADVREYIFYGLIRNKTKKSVSFFIPVNEINFVSTFDESEIYEKITISSK